MSIHVTRAPTAPLTSYDTKRSSHLNLLAQNRIIFEKLLYKISNFRDQIFRHSLDSSDTKIYDEILNSIK